MLSINMDNILPERSPVRQESRLIVPGEHISMSLINIYYATTSVSGDFVYKSFRSIGTEILDIIISNMTAEK